MKRLLFVCFAAAILFTGCIVSTDTYNKAVDESEARRIRAEKLSAGLDAETKVNEKLRKDLAVLAAAKQDEAAALKAQLDELSNKGIMTSKEAEDLRQDRARLAASETELVSARKALEGEVAGKVSEANTLRNQVDECSARAAALTKEMDGVKASDKAKAEEIALLNATLINVTKENEYLKREVERLQVKSGEISAEKEKEIANVKNTYEDLVREMQKEIDKGDIKITQAVDRLSVNMVEKILFDSGKAEVKPEGLKVIKRVGDILKGVKDRQIRVEGHTDNKQIGGKLREKYPTNWELSTARAANVVRYLQDNVGVNPKLLSVAGLADNKPVASNGTLEGRAQNRRIEIVLLPLDVDRVLEELKK